MKPNSVAAVLLAAGSSLRFGEEDKLLAPYRGKLLGQHAMLVMAALPFSHKFAIVRPEPSELHVKLERREFDMLPNDQPELGISHSIAMAAAHAEALKCDGLVIVLADMPNIPVSHLTNLCAQAEDRRAIICTSNGMTPSLPAFFGRSHFGQLQQLRGDTGARALLAQAVEIEIAQSMLHDVDVPEDLQR